MPEDAGSHLGERPSEKIFSSRRRERRVNHETLWCPGDEPAGKLQLIIPDTFFLLRQLHSICSRVCRSSGRRHSKNILLFERRRKNSASVRAPEKARPKRERESSTIQLSMINWTRHIYQNYKVQISCLLSSIAGSLSQRW